jgi:hypothetical protein
VRSILAAGWLAFVWLLVGASPAHFWLDSGEIGGAGLDLGVMHPPGAPGYALLLRFATLLPLGSLGFRMAVLGALLGAATVAGVFAILQRRGAHPWIAWGAAVWLLAGWTFVRQTRVVEIYALEGALLVAVLWAFDPDVPAERAVGRRLVGVLAAVWAAWCFGDLRLALVPAVIVGWAVAMRRRRQWARWAPLLVVMASAVALTLPLASARAPMADWNDPDTLPKWWDHVTALSIRRAYDPEILPHSAAMWWRNLAAALGVLADDLGPVGPAIGGLCVIALWWRGHDERRAWTAAAGMAWIVAVELVYAVGINPMGIADRQNGLVLAPLFALAVGETVRRFVKPQRPVVWGVVPLLFTVLAGPAALHSLDDLDDTRSWGPHAWTRAALAQLPPGALLLTQSDDLAAGVFHAKLVDGARPDVVAIPSQHLYKPVPEAYGEDTPAARTWAAGHAQPDESSRIAAAAAAHQGPIALEYPAIGLHENVPIWSNIGRLPLRLRKVPAHAPDLPEPETPAATLVRWQPRLQTREDRKRLVNAMANEGRALLRVQQDLRGATAWLTTAIEQVSDEDAAALVALGALRDRAGDREAAIALTRRALEIDPDRATALENLALYLGRDRATLAEAVTLAERAVTLRPWRAKGWVRLAASYEAQGDAAAAARARHEADMLREEGVE